MRQKHLLQFFMHGLIVMSVMLQSHVAHAAEKEAAWQVVGQQGLVRFVIVPQSESWDRAAYEKQIKQLCEPDRTCFLNFYTNTKNAAVTMPLPDVIDQEATAVFRRSSKQGAERFQWSCRLKLTNDPCF